MALDYDVRWRWRSIRIRRPHPLRKVPNDRSKSFRPSRPDPAYRRSGRHAQKPVRRLCRPTRAGRGPDPRRHGDRGRARGPQAAPARQLSRRPDYRLARHGDRQGTLERRHRRLAARSRRRRPAHVRHLLRPPAAGPCAGRQGGLQPGRPRSRHPDGGIAAPRRRRQAAGRAAAHVPGPDAARPDRAAAPPPGAAEKLARPTWTSTR